MKQEKDTLIIKFKNYNKIITNEVPFDITINRFINIFYAAMVSNGLSDTCIVTSMNQYVNEEDYPYYYSDETIDENENNNFIQIIGKGFYSDLNVKVEYTEDSTALDIVNILYGLLINLTYTRSTIIEAFRIFVNDNKELILDFSNLNNDENLYNKLIENSKEEHITNTTNNEIKDTFIQSFVKSMKK